MNRRQAILGATGDRGPLLYLHGHYDVVPAFAPTSSARDSPTAA